MILRHFAEVLVSKWCIDNKIPGTFQIPKGFISPEITKKVEEKLRFLNLRSCFSSFSYSNAALLIRSSWCLGIYEIKVIISIACCCLISLVWMNPATVGRWQDPMGTCRGRGGVERDALRCWSAQHFWHACRAEHQTTHVSDCLLTKGSASHASVCGLSPSCIFKRLWNMQPLTSSDVSLIRAQRNSVLPIHVNTCAAKSHHSRLTWTGPYAQKYIWFIDKLGARESPHSTVSRWELWKWSGHVIRDGR